MSLQWIFRKFDVPIPVHATTPGISTALFERDEIRYLVAVNNGNESKTADIVLSDQRAYCLDDLMRGRRDTIAGKLSIDLPCKDGAVLRLTPQKREQYAES